MTQVFHLWRLQKADTQLDQIAVRLKEIDLQISTDIAIQVAQNDLLASEKAVKDCHLKLKKAEDAVQILCIKIETNEAALYSGNIKNPKELQDHQNEITSSKKFLSQLEDTQLEAMIQLEKAEKQHDLNKKQLVKAQGDFATRSASLLGEKSALQSRCEQLTAERSAGLGTIDSASLEIYKKLRAQKRGLAVAAVEDSSCTACGAGLRPSEIQLARSPNSLFYCASCGRILYVS